MLDHVIVATDGTGSGNRAAEYCLALADRYDATVDVVHVREGAADADAGDRTSLERQLLDGAAASAGDAGVAVETHVLEGRPAGRITEFGADRDADLVVMGRRGRSGLSGHLLGSTTERVLRTSDVPVLAVPDGDGPVALDDVLLTTDGSEAAEVAVPHAADVAGRCGATLHVLSAVDVQGEAGMIDAGGVGSEFVERLEDEARDAVERAASRATAASDAAVEDPTVETAVVRDVPHEAVREYVADEGVDLVVLASEGQTNLAGQRLGSVAGRVLRTTEVPVLVVPVRS